MNDTKGLNAIEVKGLSKRFGRVVAIDGVDLVVPAGKVVGFLGPNGAGKSTTMNVLLGFLNADAGEAWLNGQRVTADGCEVRKGVGFLANGMALDDGLTAEQELKYFAQLNDADGEDDGGAQSLEYAQELALRFKLELRQKVGTLSTGNHQKLALIIALMHRPKTLILDEPTNGLDPLVQVEFNKVIAELKAGGATVFISSHILSEVNELCDEFVFIKAGRIVARRTRAELKNSGGKTITVSKPEFATVKRLLDKHGIKFSVGSGSELSDEFMQYYEEGGR